MPNILLISPHQLMINSLESLLATQTSYDVYSQTIEQSTATHAHSIQEEIDLIMLDAQHQDAHDIALIHQLRRRYTAPKILILANAFDASHVRKLLANGINGYILKDSSSRDLFHVMTQIFKNEEYYDERVKNLLLKSYQPRGQKFKTYTPLTKREKEVVKYIAEGFNIHEIADQMIVSKSTIESHRKNVYIKLGLNKTALLVRYALDQGIIE